METLEQLFSLMEENGERPAIRTQEETVTYQDLINRSKSLALGFREKINPGDKIAVWLPNSIDWIVVELAAALIGATVVTLNMRYKIQELSYILQDSESKMLLFKPTVDKYDYTDLVEKLIVENKEQLSNLKYIVSSEKLEKQLSFVTLELSYFYRNVDNNEVPLLENRDPNTVLNILYTSGTTSNPKGVMLSQKTVIKHSSIAADHLTINKEDVFIGALPFCGVFGLNTLFASLTKAATIIPIERYKPMEVAKIMQNYKCTVFIGVDGMVTPFFGNEPDLDLSAVRIGVFAIFSTNTKYFYEAAAKIYPNMKVFQPYGMSEVCALLFLANPDSPLEERLLPGGYPVSSEVEVDILDEETGEPLEDGQEGEIAIAGYNVMLGYYNNPDKTKESFTKDGKFKTGDLGVRLPSGFIVYKGRLRDVIRSKGFLISPKEIEDYIGLLSGVEIAQVVSVTKNNKQKLIAFVKTQDGHSLLEKDVLDYCRKELADFKCPDHVFFIDQFPTTAGSNGEKIQKVKLQEMAEEKLKMKNI